ncbi:hypothetical protein NLG97_g8621 [Lecanicillium saksenae]|uniref:Uncharacterized protein n=1 Tax=Lecanicillium saksenae TaxID=468837 RepID=A0ACC1QIY6_9HYPO|nr:hypothetical protein NLG97_g8621 [Lecanicillium saksenae]
MAKDYSDLEVYYGPPSTDPIEAQEEKIVTYVRESAVPKFAIVREEKLPPRPERSSRTICSFCGVRFTRTRISILIVLTLIIAGGVAAGVVASLASAKNSQSRKPSPAGGEASSDAASGASGSSSATTSTAPTTTTEPPVSLSTYIEVASPTQTLYRDCPSSNNTIYNALGSNVYQFRKICSRSFNQPKANVVNHVAKSLDDCIDLCVAYNIKNRTEIAAGGSSPCNSVCWRNRADDPDWPGQCFGSTIFNSTAGFQIKDETICDSGAWINQVV